MIHLDTNFIIQALVPGSPAEGKVRAWLLAGEDLGTSAIAWSEFLCGPVTLQDETLAQTFLAAPEPFLAVDARKAADLFNATGRRSREPRRLPDCRQCIALRRQGGNWQPLRFRAFPKPRIGSGLTWRRSQLLIAPTGCKPVRACQTRP